MYSTELKLEIVQKYLQGTAPGLKNWQKNIMYTKVISRNGEMLIWNMV